MDLVYNLGYYVALFLIPFVVYFLLFKKNDRTVYAGRDLFYLVKLYVAKKAVIKYQEKFQTQTNFSKEKLETRLKVPTDEHTIAQYFNAADQKGNSLTLKFILRHEKVAEVFLCLRLQDGTVYVLPDESNVRVTKIPKNEWKINGLNIETLEPFTRYRISFNGLLRNHEKIEYVQFSFIFNSCGSPTYIPHEMDANLLSDALAKENWKDGSWMNYLADQTGYEQFGVLQGFLKGHSYPDELALNLPACRTRHAGFDDRFLLTRALRIFLADTYGNLINVVIKSFKNGCSQINYGSAILSDNTILPIKGVDILLSNFSAHKIIPETITTEIKVGAKLFKCVIHLNVTKSLLSVNAEPNGHESYLVPAECDVNTNQAKVIVEFWFSKHGTTQFAPNAVLHPRNVHDLQESLVVNIDSEEARILQLSGGKGNSLALLSSLRSSDFIIPEGFVVTVNSFKLQLQANPTIAKTVLLLDDVCCKRKKGKLETICEEVVGLLKKEKILPEITEAIKLALNSVGNGREGLRWAVRSSAIGEDSEELSAAGQNDTFLGCREHEQVLKSVRACWASLFSYQSVQYRHQHGIPVLSEMAVVVQRMVPADSAGVLFTCHPFSFDPSRMVVTSNYGLGESVVSGKSDPDTFVLGRAWDDTVSLLDKTLGRKNKVIKMTDGGVEESESEPSSNWSISEAKALQLGRVGVALEKAFAGPRDIEWAFYEDKLYLLQSRPITTLNAWSDFDLTHELDYPVRSEYTILSTGNVGEVMPTAISVLSQTSLVLGVAWASELRLKHRFDPFAFQNILRRQHRGVIDVVNFLHKNVNKDVKITSTIMDLAVFGHAVFDEKINDICKNVKGVTPPWDLVKEVLELLTLAVKSQSICKQMKAAVHELSIDVNVDDPLLENYNRIDEALKKLPYVLLHHTEVSSISVFYQVVAMNVLLEGSQTLTKDHCTDFATILSCCKDVISAEVPTYLAKIARIVREEGYNEEFCTIKPEYGVSWLENKCPEAFKLFQEFMRKHGHRSQSEFDVMVESWQENPSKVISMIQANAKHEPVTSKSQKSASGIVRSLLSPKSSITRNIIKFIIGRIQSSVANRELTKCELVRAFDKFKQAYRSLASQMVFQGVLPSPDLIHHLTHYEVGQVIQNRNPLLVAKAFRRQKLYPKWNKTKFPEISFGVPVPENETTEKFIESIDKVCVGTAACAGTVEGRACVIHSLEEIDQLQAGDILITVSTDIAWSPYFPMLSGIVTELGGLISHGAVVAREYGLPCIVGVKEATKVFKTGDTVVVSGSTGKVGKAANFLEVL